MLSPKFPKNETERLDAVKSYNILDTLPESDFDAITKLVAAICDVPISLITVLDKKRNYFKSHFGIPFNESPRDISFCGHTILKDEIMIIPDSRKDSRFEDNPLVAEAQAIFYAGVPLINPKGLPLGTICVFDHKPRELSELQIETLKTLGKQVVNLFELRKKNDILKNNRRELIKRNQQLKAFASHVSHDLKSPLANIISLTQLLRDELDVTASKDALVYIHHMEDSSEILKNYIDGILLHYKSDELLKAKKEDIKLEKLLRDIKQILASENDELIFPSITIPHINKSALAQILINLIDNALKYNDKSKRIITIDYNFDDYFHKFTVSDNGIGIQDNQHQQIFEIFKTVKNDFGKSSTGIGLSTVKSLVEKLGGKISLKSTYGKGSAFHFTIKK